MFCGSSCPFELGNRLDEEESFACLNCAMADCYLHIFLNLPLVGLQSVIVAFHDNTHFQGVVRTLKSYAYKRETTVSSNGYLQLRPFFKMGTTLKRKSDFFPLRAVSQGMKNHFYHIRWAPLSVTIFISHVRILRNGSYANVLPFRPRCRSVTPLTFSNCISVRHGQK